MSIAYGTLTTLDTTGTRTGPTITGSDVIGIVHVMGDTADNVPTVTWVKGGVATSMTLITKVRCPGDRYIYSLWIANPDSAGQIVVTGPAIKYNRAEYFTGVEQTTPIDVSGTSTSSSSTTVATTVSVTASNCWLVFFQKDSSGGVTYTTSVGTLRFGGTADGTGLVVGDSNGIVSTGSNTVTLTSSGSTNHGMVMFALKESGSTPITNSNFLQFM